MHHRQRVKLPAKVPGQTASRNHRPGTARLLERREDDLRNAHLNRCLLPAAQLPQLVELGLDVGDDTTVEVANLQFCLDTLMANPPFAGANVVITRGDGRDTRVTYLEIDDERPTH